MPNIPTDTSSHPETPAFPDTFSAIWQRTTKLLPGQIIAKPHEMNTNLLTDTVPFLESDVVRLFQPLAFCRSLLCYSLLSLLQILVLQIAVARSQRSACCCSFGFEKSALFAGFLGTVVTLHVVGSLMKPFPVVCSNASSTCSTAAVRVRHIS